jgi:XTP/dITP diphosphohydrolase
LFGGLVINATASTNIADLPMQKKIVLASGNAGKLTELQSLLAPLGVQLVSQQALGIDDAPEPFCTFVENALNKARHASRLSGLAAVADDSGICVPSLHGAPGVYSARYAAMAGLVTESESKQAIDQANNVHLLTQLRQAMAVVGDKPSINKAFYFCVLVFINHPDDPSPIIADAVWQGELVFDARGTGGFGYDPHFYLPDLGKTVAELSVEKKNALSHRAQAAKELLSKMRLGNR